MKYLKYILLITIIFGFLGSFFIFDNQVNAATVPTKQINVVYDDSGSMYEVKRGGEHVDTWGKAKYAMEVFVSMLGEQDTMNVYYMSDYGQGATNPPRLTLSGSSNAQANVDTIHNEKTTSSNTYFNTIVKAMTDLKASKADKKWLVILTDGEMEDGRKPISEIDKFLEDKSANTSVVFLAMGAKAKAITNNPDKGIYVYKADSNDQIINRVTEISNRIFMNNKVAVNNGTFNIDIPMKEFTVFVQGSNLTYNGLKDNSGKVISNSENPVKVRGSSCDAIDQDNEPTTGLNGLVIVYNGDFDPGNYKVDVQGYESIEVYYKPNIEACVDLIDSTGNVVENVDNIEAGDYTLSFGFVKAGTNQRINKDSKLLGDVDYKARFIINGVEYPGQYKDGDKITLEEGDIAIDVTANYLDYNTVETHIAYGIFLNKYVTFKVVKDPVFVVDKQGFTNSESENYIEIEAQVSGVTLDQETWDNMIVPSITLDTPLILRYVDQPNWVDSVRVEKTNEIGIYRLYPEIDGKPTVGIYSETKYTLNYSQTVGIDSWIGTMENSVKVNDIRSWIDHNWDLFIKLLITLIILLIIAGYFPMFKNYLPSGLVRKPFIEVSSIGNKVPNTNGKFEKKIIYTFIPYASERGVIKFVPPSFTGFPRAQVKAVRNNRMVVTNAKAYINKKVTFGSVQVMGKGTEVKLSKNTPIYSTSDTGIDAVCYLNTKR